MPHSCLVRGARVAVATVAFAIGPSAEVAAQPRAPLVHLTRAEQLSSARARVRVGDSTLAPAYARLLADAKAALIAGPWSVTEKKRLAPSGDRHDYMSFGPYWWPDPSKPDGLPYIRRDGQVNPGSRGTESNSPSFKLMSSAVSTLALAYYFSDDEQYARRAALLLRTWFVDSATRMNPNLRYGQAIPGVTEGRGIGLIDTRDLSSIVDAIGLLRASRHWTPGDDRAMHDWAAEFIRWMRTSPQGQDEAKATNNHGTWYDVQLVALAYFVGDTALASETIRTRTTRRIDEQILPDGRQPRELERTRSLSYSVFNLEAFTRLAELARFAGVDLWHRVPPAGGGIVTALRLLAPYTDRTRTWGAQQITPPDPLELLAPLRRAELALRDDSLHAALQRIPVAVRATHRSRLLYPAGP
jgi:hypothetical protein